ncbi:hypothetical protein [Anaeromassilibacillus senegalensis]|uniref:hypothetical protein n=1 Tax=Anaeromassilibacillus senegalensis TaxID=1673717 RepID=UPI0006816720|nr:hypothetical protein [Anaeromassilibacillus senegalensis]
MSVKIISAKIEPQIVNAGTQYQITIGAEEYGVLMEYMGYILADSDGMELHTADKKDYLLNYTDTEIDAALGWLLDLGRQLE